MYIISENCMSVCFFMAPLSCVQYTCEQSRHLAKGGGEGWLKTFKSTIDSSSSIVKCIYIITKLPDFHMRYNYKVKILFFDRCQSVHKLKWICMYEWSSLN